MMKCDSIAFDDLLDAEDDIETHNPEVARHLETCTHCQSRLAGLAADAEQWDETRHWLSTGDVNDPVYAESLEARERWKRPIAWNDAMAKSLLSAASHPEMLGRIGRYDVERLIGSGGMGVVFKAYDTELNRPVAVKLLAPYLASSGAARSRFAREARAAAAVVDDHVVPIHNVETDGEHPFLVMKYIAGGSLQQRLDRDGSLEVCEVLRIGMQTAKGLAAAHAQGLIHRDVKPSNILLDEGVDRALLTDFGLARATDDASLTRSGFHPGTPHYMSPEQVRGEAIDARSDLFGLGCVLYALCTGHPPFRSETSYAVLRRITDDTPRPIRETNPDIPEWLERVVMKLLAKSPDARFDSASEVADLLEACLAHVQHPLNASLPECVAAMLPVRGSRPPWSKLVAVAAFGFSIIFAGVLIVLETNKGTLTIESDVDDVPIRIMQGDKVVERLTVTRAGETTRIAAGNYVVAIDGGFASLTVSGNVTLTRGSKATVKIEKSAQDLGVANTNVSSLIDQSGDSGMFSPVPGSEVRYVNDVANEKWGDGEPLQVAKRVFAARRQLLSDFQLSYRTISLPPENSDEAAEHSTLPKNASDVGSEAVANKSTQEEAKHGSRIVTVGFAGSTVYYYDRPSKKGKPATGWIYDGQTMTRLQSVSDNEPLQVVADVSTVPDFSGLFGVEPNPLQFAGLLAMSQDTVPYIDKLLDEGSDATARWILRETGSYANPRPWIPRCDRMLLIEFNCTLPVLSQTESGKPDSTVSPVRVTYVLDPGSDYWPIWFQTQTQSDTRAFRTTLVRQQNIAGNTVYFPDRMIEETERTYGIEVIDLVLGKPVNLKTVFGDASPDLTGYEAEAPHQKADEMSDTINPQSIRLPEPEEESSGNNSTTANLTLVDAVKQFNWSSLNARQDLYDPPIPDLAIDQFRDAMLSGAYDFKNESPVYHQSASDAEVNQILRQFAETGELPFGLRGDLTSPVDTYERDTDGQITLLRTLPRLTLFRDNNTKSNVLNSGATIDFDSLELIYQEDGSSSKRYGDPALSETRKKLAKPIEKPAASATSGPEFYEAKRIADQFVAALVLGRDTDRKACLSTAYQTNLDDEHKLRSLSQEITGSNPDFTEMYINPRGVVSLGRAIMQRVDGSM